MEWGFFSYIFYIYVQPFELWQTFERRLYLSKSWPQPSPDNLIDFFCLSSNQCILLISIIHLSMYYTHSYTPLSVFLSSMYSTYQCTLLINLLHSSVYPTYQCTPFISVLVLHSVYSAHQCTPLISILHSSVYSTCQCTPLISVIHSPVYSTY